MTKSIWLLLTVLSATFSPASADASPRSATVPLMVAHNRAFVEVEFARPDGSSRKARFWVDNGNPDLALSEALGRDLGLDISKPEKNEDGMSVAYVTLSRMTIGGMVLETEGSHAAVILGDPHIFPEKQVEGILPSTVLKHYQVMFDYPGHRFTIAQPGTLKARGKRISCDIHPATGMALMSVMIDGKANNVTLDMGSAFTLFSEASVQKWATEHPEWPRVQGAVGAANMFGAPYEAQSILMRLPEIRLPEMQAKSLNIKNEAVASMPNDFFEWYSKKTTHPATGAIGGNILKSFRVTIDYPNSAIYLERKMNQSDDELALVGLILAPSRDRDGRFGIRGIAKKDGKDTVEGVQPGDKLLQVDGIETQGLTMDSVIDSLRGKPGDIHTLLLERKGKQLTVKATVRMLL
jgi:hypothetical protein